jgi:Tfp pilus assembly protein PilE
MADTPNTLTPDEASAIEAIGGAPAAVASQAAAHEEASEPALHEEASAEESHPAGEHGNEGGALHGAGHEDGHHDTHHTDHHEAEHPAQDTQDAEMAEMKSTMLDSAELANRAAGMAAKAAGNMHSASTQLIESYSAQKMYLIIVLAVFGLLMVLAISLFAFMSFRLQQRVTQADAMLIAVGKRVIAMDESLELFTGHGEALREVASKQDAIISAQTKIELRLDEVMRGVQAAADSIAKPANDKDKDKAPDVAKLIKDLDGKLAAQASAISNLSSQVRSAGTPTPSRPDPAAVRKEAEAIVRQLKAAEASVKPATPATTAPAAPKVPEKPVEKVVQYPRIQKTPEGQ